MKPGSLLVSCLAGMAMANCALAQDLPPFIEDIIVEFGGTTEPAVTSEPAPDGEGVMVRSTLSRLEIWQYEYQGQTVYYLPFARTHCCDALSMLYDAEGKLLCMPDGGLTGTGDGRCANFAAARSVGVQVYGAGKRADAPGDPPPSFPGDAAAPAAGAGL